MAVEARRGCGYRKVGGLYLVSEGGGVPCDRLPFPLHVCPACGGGIKQTRGWTWVNPKMLFGGPHDRCIDDSLCVVCRAEIERAGLLWIGERFYKTPADFVREGDTLGFCRRIIAVPRGFKVGETWVLLAHPKACLADSTVIADLIGEKEEANYVPGIFRVWRPARIEKILPESTRGSEEVSKLVEAGITPVFVPDSDKDHRGTVYDKDDDDVNGELPIGTQPATTEKPTD